MRILAGFGILIILFAGLVTGVWFQRAGLAYLPVAEALPLEFPTSAFAVGADRLLVIDRSGFRMLLASRSGELIWDSWDSGFYGRIIAAAGNGTNPVYCIDQLDDETASGRFQRLVRIGEDGQPAGVLLQKKPEGLAGFVPGALCQSASSLYYLYADDRGLVGLYEFSLADSSERLLVGSDWNITSASLAVSPDGEQVFIGTGGALVRYASDRFDFVVPFAEGRSHATQLAFDSAGRLLVADALSGQLNSFPASASPVLRQSDSGLAPRIIAGSPTETSAWLRARLGFDALAVPAVAASTLDFFSVARDGFVTVDQGGNRVSWFSSDGISRLSLEALTLPTALRDRIRLSWLLLAAAVFLGLLILVLALLRVVLVAHPVPAMIVTCLPPLALIFMAVLITLFHGSLVQLQSGQQVALAGLEGFVGSGVALLEQDGFGALTEVYRNDLRVLGSLRRTLQSLGGTYRGNAPVSLSLWHYDKGTWIYLADNETVQLPGQPYRNASANSAQALASGASLAYLQRRAEPVGSATPVWRENSGRNYQSLRYVALAPLQDQDGRLTGLLEASMPASETGITLLLDDTFRRNRLFWVFLGCGAALLLLSIGLFSGVRMESVAVRDEYLPQASDAAQDTVNPPDLPPDFERDAGLIDADLDSLIDETHIDLNGMNEVETTNKDAVVPGAVPVPGEPVAELAMDEINFTVAGIDAEETEHRPAASQVEPSPPGRMPREMPSLAMPVPERFSVDEHTNCHRQAIAALKAGDYDEAVVLLERLLDTWSGDARAWNNLGIAYKRQGRLAMAIRAVEKALVLEPDNTDTRRNLEALKKLAS